MSKVYFITRKSGPENPIMKRLEVLIEKMDFGRGIAVNDPVAVKVHFGEEGVTTYLRPVYVKPFVAALKKLGAKPFLTDANTIYRGKRSDGVTHIETALSNGFGYGVTGAPVIIADGIDGSDYAEVEVPGEYFSSVKIAGEAHRSQAMVVLSHFKGHEMFGFGGALKNIGMGLACKQGKLSLHSTVSPYVKKEQCILCGTCAKWCPADAIEMKKESAVIVEARCIGCGQCIMSCPPNAITLKWDMDFSEAQLKTAEYGCGVMKNKKGRIWFFNFLMDITPECDCYGYSDIPLVPDIGILASDDPVALDQASYDMVMKAEAIPGSKADGAGSGEDKFKMGHPQTNPEPMLEYARKLGMGTREYSIVEIG